MTTRFVKSQCYFSFIDTPEYDDTHKSIVFYGTHKKVPNEMLTNRKWKFYSLASRNEDNYCPPYLNAFSACNTYKITIPAFEMGLLYGYTIKILEK